ncbi:MAG: hypothetical protein JXA22_06480 [Candidatus Thermoplasmatota archaeon]|nr:hypothetical protein [Candidatus Thermoplasmatota archaeon]
MSPVGGKKNYKVRTGARTASKGLEKELKRKAKRLSQDPSLALPRCTVNVPYFRNLERKLEEVSRSKDNKRALEKASKKGDKLIRAYAATLILLHEEKIPYLAVFKSPFGDVGYAHRGETSREKLVGIQNYEDPRIKMMAYLEEVKKKRLFMFVTENEVICTGTDPMPPKEVIDALPKRLGKGMKRSGNVIHSPHIRANIVQKGEPWKEPYLVVSWDVADILMAKNLTYTLQNQDNTFATCASYMASEKISRYFSVEVNVRPICDHGTGCPCDPPARKEKKESFIQRLGKVKEQTSLEIYMEGKMMDHRLIEKELDDYRKRLEEVGETVYIISNRCFGSDHEAVMTSLTLTKEEKEALKSFFTHAKGPIISSDPTTNKIMEPFWKDVGEKVLNDLIGNKKIAKEVFNSFPTPRYQPMTVVQEAIYRMEESGMRAKLPTPKDPPRMIEFAYECAIAYLVRGGEGASKVVERYGDDDIKVKAAKYAFVKGLNLTRSAGWSYTTHEMGYAQGLDEIVVELAQDDPGKFKIGLTRLWKATGSTQDLEWE